jgi:hypothetical protein
MEEDHTKTVCVLGDGKYIGFMAYDDSQTNGAGRLRGKYVIFDVENKCIFRSLGRSDYFYYVVPLGDKWLTLTYNPDDGATAFTTYNYLTGERVINASAGAPYCYEMLAFDKYVIVSCGYIACYNLETAAEIFHIPNDDCLFIELIQFHDDGLLKVIIDNQVNMYDLRTLNIVEQREARDDDLVESMFYCDEKASYEIEDKGYDFQDYNIDYKNACRYTILKDGSLLKEYFLVNNMHMQERLVKCISYKDVSFTFTPSENNEEEIIRPTKRARIEEEY